MPLCNLELFLSFCMGHAWVDSFVLVRFLLAESI